MTEPDEALLWARESAYQRALEMLDGDETEALAQIDHEDAEYVINWLAEAYRAGAAASAERIKELEARVAELEDMASRYLIQMSDMLTRLNERHPEDFVWLKDGDEPTAEDAYGWGCQGWGDPR